MCVCVCVCARVRASVRAQRHAGCPPWSEARAQSCQTMNGTPLNPAGPPMPHDTAPLHASLYRFMSELHPCHRIGDGTPESYPVSLRPRQLQNKPRACRRSPATVPEYFCCSASQPRTKQHRTVRYATQAPRLARLGTNAVSLSCLGPLGATLSIARTVYYITIA